VLSLVEAVTRIKADVAKSIRPELVTKLCAELSLRGRDRLYPPPVTTSLALVRALHAAPMAALRHHSGQDVSAQAYSQALARLPVAYFARLQQAVVEDGQQAEPGRVRQRWNGRRLFLIDGSSFSMPDTPELQATFGQHPQQQPGCGFPTAHLLIQFAAHSGLALKTIVAPWRTHDMAHATATHDALGTGDILVGDRAFASFGHLAVLLQRGLHGVFRAHQVRKVHRQRGSRDRYVTYDKPVHKPAWMTDEEFARLPGSMLVREVRVRLNEPGLRVRELVLVTTLLDAVSYPPSMIAQMFGVRWSAEVNLRHLKQTLGLDVLRSRSVDGILKELHAFVIIYNLVRKLMCAAARRQKVAPDRISFVDTLRWLRSTQVVDALPTLLVVPNRPGRHQPRVKKRRPKSYTLMTRPRHELLQRLKIRCPRSLT
jgi:hypothetical protein